MALAPRYGNLPVGETQLAGGRVANPRTAFRLSEALWERAVRVIPCGTQTLSKGPDQFVWGVTPKYLVRGKGCHVWDVDGNEYIDYPLALGPILLGYDYPEVSQAVIRQLREGTTFTLMHPLEVELAELLTEIIPCAEMVRFGKNGSDATSAAVRAARAYTGRDHIAYCGYHGCQDWYAVVTPRNKGIPSVLADLIHPFEYNDLSSLERIFDAYPGRIAAVILEQPGEEPRDNFLARVKDLAHRHGALFIMDEIVTGFRYALGGAQEYYGVVPDLACFGKGMANGFSISAVVGRREVMKEFEEVFFSMTFAGETTGLAAALATIKVVREREVIAHIWRQGERLRTGLAELARRHGVPLELAGNPPRTHLVFRDENGRESLLLKSLFLQETVKRGILFGGPVFISFSHGDGDIERTLEAADAAMALVRRALEYGDARAFLQGRPIDVVFRPRR